MTTDHNIVTNVFTKSPQLRTCWANKLAQTGPWPLTQPPVTPDVSLVDDVVITKHGCLIARMMTLLTPRAQLETNPILPGLAPAGLPVLRQVASQPAQPSPSHQPRSLSALSVFSAPHHTLRTQTDNTSPARRLRVLGTHRLTAPAKLKIAR